MLDSSFRWDLTEVGAPSESSPEEPMGTKDKFWTDLGDGSRWLFKFAREADGDVRNEDWAEWIVWNLARLLGIPAAEVRPAECMGRRGIISRSVLSSDEILVHGNELLHDFDSEYQLDVKRENPDYTIDAIESALRAVGPPSGYPELTTFSGFGVMSAYLMLDARCSCGGT